MRHRLDTRIHLAQELEKYPRTPQIQKIIDEAKAGEFHDYKNRKYPCGKIAASSMLRDAGLIDLAIRIEKGDFDEEADEEDLEEMRRAIPERLWPAFRLERQV